jgi:hypothetical protein
MDASSGTGVILVLIFAALILFTFFLLFKRGTGGILGNKYLIYLAAGGVIVFFLLARRPMADFYRSIFKEAPYGFSELKSFVFKYGDKDSLVNQYNSASGEFQYLNKSNSLVKTHLYLTTTDLLYLHRKAAELGFWDFPANEVNSDTTNTNGIKPTEYLVEFNYLHKSKTLLFTANYDGPQQLTENSKQLIKEIQAILRGAEDRQRN